MGLPDGTLTGIIKYSRVQLNLIRVNYVAMEVIMGMHKEQRRTLAHLSLVGLALLVIILATLLFVPSCAILSKFLQLKVDPFSIELVFLEETISVNIPGHWPKDILEFPQSGYPLFYPV